MNVFVSIAVCLLLNASSVTGLSSGLSVWPLPKYQSLGEDVFTLVREKGSFFKLSMPSPSPSPLLERGFSRYEEMLFNCSVDADVSIVPMRPTITGIEVTVANMSEQLDVKTSEQYSLEISNCPNSPCYGQIRADTIFGVLHALQSLSQLVIGCGALPCAPVILQDQPRFPWRGLMVDTARHFLGVEKLRQTIDAMVGSKLNVLHLHLTDAQSFSFASKKFPQIAQGTFNGSDFCRSPFNPLNPQASVDFTSGGTTSCSYSSKELKDLVAYARDHGVRTVPEIDSPAHSASWCVGFPGMCISCNVSHVPDGNAHNGRFPPGVCSSKSPPKECRWGEFSLLDPSRNITWAVLSGLFGELSEIFDDRYFHMGFDEAHWDCYNQPHINQWMQRVGIPRGDYKGIMRWYLSRLQTLVQDNQKTGVVWQEAYDHYGPANYPPATPPPKELHVDTVVQIWYSPTWYDPPTGLPVGKTLNEVVATGRSALISFPWYLNANASSGPSFQQLYLQDVQSNKTCVAPNRDGPGPVCTCFGRTGEVEDSCYEVSDAAELKRVLGGEAALWGEHVDARNLNRAAFMAAAVVAERLWSPRSTLNVTDAHQRLLLMQRRMADRGYVDSGMPPLEKDPLASGKAVVHI